MTITSPGHKNTSRVNGGESQVNKPTAKIVPPGGGKTLHALGTQITVNLGGAETGGTFTLFTETTPPEGGPPPHYHENADEWFIPLEGRVEFLLDGIWTEVPMRSTVYIPRGTVHTFRNIGDTPLIMLIHIAPSGFEIFFERCAEEFAKPGPPNMERIHALSAEHGIHHLLDGNGPE